MNPLDLKALSPFITLAATSLLLMVGIAFRRNLRIVAVLTTTGLALALALLMTESLSVIPRQVTPLLMLDHFTLGYVALILAASLCVSIFSFGYLEKHPGDRDEFFLLLVLGTLGAAVLVAGSHFASLFLGLEILSVSLYAMIAYLRRNARGLEAGLKYLILAGASSAFLLFGMALVYAELGTMEFGRLASQAAEAGAASLLLPAGLAMMVTAFGFKLALVPFHFWTPDVYEGAPAPVAAFVATVSKGATFALMLRFFSVINLSAYPPLVTVFTVLAIASMFVGNLLALLQNNVKRILAYSSVSHMGYLTAAFLAAGAIAPVAAAFYLVAYVVTTLGAFGMIAVLSGRDRDADSLDDYRGLALQRPWHAGVFTAMLLSLAGIPLTAGFIGKFFIVAAGTESALWPLVAAVILSSTIGLFYYLRIIAAMYVRPEQGTIRKGHTLRERMPLTGSLLLTVLTLLLLWLGVYPDPLIRIIREAVSRIV